MIPAAAIAQARTIAEAHMPDRAEWLITTPGADDNEGGTLPGTTTVETSVCRLGVPTREMERLIAEQVLDPTSMPLSFPVNQTRSANDRVRITSARHGTVATYELTSVEGRHSYSVEGKATVRKVGP